MGVIDKNKKHWGKLGSSGTFLRPKLARMHIVSRGLSGIKKGSMVQRDILLNLTLKPRVNSRYYSEAESFKRILPTWFYLLQALTTELAR